MVQENATMITEADFIVRRIWTLSKNGQYQKIRKELKKTGRYLYVANIGRGDEHGGGGIAEAICRRAGKRR